MYFIAWNRDREMNKLRKTKQQKEWFHICIANTVNVIRNEIKRPSDFE